ncbi:hypothetical protein GG344DRAFT_82653 [Lentinula edodes]|nr:hypothetical protein GG344DRAFT_82653 [Lentinula edodes]
MLFNLMLVLGFASQVCAFSPPSTPSPVRKMSTRLSSMFNPKPGDVQQLEISIHYEVIGTQKLPKVDSIAQKLVKAASRRLNLPTNTKFTFIRLNEASSATGPIRFTFWGPKACESSATEGAKAESLRRVQTRVLRKRNCEVFIEDISKNELDVLMWNATHDVVYVSKHGADLPFSPPIFADDNSVLLFFVDRPTTRNRSVIKMFVNNVVYIFSVVCLDLGINLVTFVDAAAVLSTTNSILDKFNNLATLATIPSSCNDTCNAIEATISDCMTVQCVCTSSNEAALNTCVDCLEAVKPNQTVISQAQDILNQYAALCDAGGISVPIQTASGFSGSVGLPLSTTSVGSVTQSTPAGTETGASASSFSTHIPESLSTQTSILPQSTRTSVSLSTATSPGISQTGLQSTVFASSVSASSLSSLTSLASSVSASGTSSTTASVSSASKAALDQGYLAMVGISVKQRVPNSNPVCLGGALNTHQHLTHLIPSFPSASIASVVRSVCSTMKISSSSTLIMTASLLASNVAASSLLERTSSAFDILIARQSTSSGIDPSEIPTQCETQCTTVLNTISACTTDSCICTTTNADEMESCVNCLVSIDPTADMIEEGNEILLSLEVECDTVSGFPSLSVSASSTISDDTSSVTALEGSSVSSKSTVTQKSTATGTSTTTSSADSESTSDSGIKGLNGAVSYKGSMATVVVGALGCIVGAGLLGL